MVPITSAAPASEGDGRISFALGSAVRRSLSILADVLAAIVLVLIFVDFGRNLLLLVLLGLAVACAVAARVRRR